CGQTRKPKPRVGERVFVPRLCRSERGGEVPQSGMGTSWWRGHDCPPRHNSLKAPRGRKTMLSGAFGLWQAMIDLGRPPILAKMKVLGWDRMDGMRSLNGSPLRTWPGRSGQSGH